MTIKAIFCVLLFAVVVQAQEASSQTPDQQHAEMMKRGDAEMGFSQTKTTHHFLLRKDGGLIQVSANDPKDDASRDHIRMHLSHVAQMFSVGNFDVPMFIHGTTPDGVPTMKKLHDKIHYHFEQTESGGRIMIQTDDAEALAAVHKLLRFQINAHRTGDSLEVTKADPQDEGSRP